MKPRARYRCDGGDEEVEKRKRLKEKPSSRRRASKWVDVIVMKKVR